MNNYHYLISSLPALALTWGKDAAAPSEMRKEIFEGCGKHDRGLFKWIEYAFDSEKLGPHLYRAALRHSNAFIREYLRFDLNLRNAKTAYLNKSLGREPGKDVIGIDGGEFEEAAEVSEALGCGDILEREEKLDGIIWKKAEELTEHDYFNVNVLLCYLVKLHIIERWYVLDPEKGAALFKSLVDEVRGTFGGIDMQDYMQTTKRRKTE